MSISMQLNEIRTIQTHTQIKNRTNFVFNENGTMLVTFKWKKKLSKYS